MMCIAEQVLQTCCYPREKKSSAQKRIEQFIFQFPQNIHIMYLKLM